MPHATPLAASHSLRLLCSRRLGGTAVLLAALAGSAQAAPINWTGSTSSDWQTSGNWSAGIPGATDTAVFSDAPTNTTVTGTAIGGTALSFTNTAAKTYTASAGLSGSTTVAVSGGGTAILSGSNIAYTGITTIGNGSTLSLSNASQFRSAVTNNATLNFDSSIAFASRVNDTQAIVVSGTGTITKTGSGWVGFTNTVNFGAGQTLNIQAGTIGNDNTTANWTASKASLNLSGATASLDLRANDVYVDKLDGVAGSLIGNSYQPSGVKTLFIGVNGGTGGVFNGSIQGAGGGGTDDGNVNRGQLALTKMGNGTQTLNGTNTYTGATTISGGTLQIGGAGTFGSGNYAGAITNNGTFQYSSSAGQSLSGGMSGTGGLVKDTANSTLQFFGGTVNYSGPTTINSGVVDLVNVGGYVSAATVNNGGTLRVTTSANASIASAITLNNGATLTHNCATNNWFIFGGAVTVASGANVTLNDTSVASTTGGAYFDTGLLGGAGATVTINATNAGNGFVFRNNSTTYGGTLIVNGIASATAGSGSGIGVGGCTTGLQSADIQLNGTMELGTQGGLGWAAGGNGLFKMGALSGTGVMVTNGVNSTVTLGNTGNNGTFSGKIANGTNTVSINKIGGGIQTLSGLNTYTGTTTVSGGTLRLDLGTNANVLASTNTVRLAGGTLDFTNHTTNGQTLTSVTLASGANFITNSDTSGHSGATKIDLGTLTLSGGSVEIGNLTSGLNNLADNSGANTWIKASTSPHSLNFIGAAVTTNGGHDLVATDSVGNLIVANNLPFQWGATAGPSNLASSVIKFDSAGGLGSGSNGQAGSQVITINYGGQVTAGTTEWGTIINNYASNTTVLDVTNNGATPTILRLAANGGVTSQAGGSTTIGRTVATGGTLTAGGAPATSGTLTFSTGAGATTTVNSKIADNGGAAVGTTIAGAGTTVMNGVNTYTGTTTIGGTLQIAGAGSIGGAGANYAAAITNNGTFQYSSSAAQTLSGGMSGTGALIKDANSGSTLTLSGAGVNYTGATTVNSGTLELLNTGNYVSATTVNNGGILKVTNNPSVIIGAAITLNNGATLIHNGSANQFWVNNQAVTVASGASVTLNEASAANTTFGSTFLDGGLLGGGSGSVVTINATNAGTAFAFRSGSNISNFAGTIIVNGTASTTPFVGSGIAVGGCTTGLQNADIQLNGTMELGNQGIGWANSAAGAFKMGALSGTGKVVANYSGSGGSGTSTVTLGNTNNGGTFSGQIVDGNNSVVSITKIGAGTQTFSGTNTYTGVTTVTAGTLSVGTLSGAAATADNLGQNNHAAANLVLNGGTLQYTGATASTDRAFTLANGTGSTIEVTNGASNLTVSGASASTSGGLAKTGAGTLTLSGANSYTGSTTVNGGTLLVNNTHNAGAAANTYVVNTGAVLGGNGTIQSATSVSIGSSGTGAFTAGAAGTIDTLTVNAPAVSLSGTYLFDVNYAAAGQKGDLLNITGATAGQVSLAGTLKLAELSSAPVAGSHYAIKILQSNVAVAGYAGPGQHNYAGTVSGLAANQTIITWDGGKTFYLVPEPASFALLGLGALLLLRRPSRRRRAQNA